MFLSERPTATEVWRFDHDPELTSQYCGSAYEAGQSYLLDYALAGGGSLNYQWYQNASNPVGVNASNLTLAAAQPSQSGLYSVVITNASGSVTSSPAQLLVVPPPAALSARNLPGDWM